MYVLDMRPHFPLAKIMLWPAVPQRVQIVTGLGRFMRLDSTFYHLNRFVGERAARLRPPHDKVRICQIPPNRLQPVDRIAPTWSIGLSTIGQSAVFDRAPDSHDHV